MNHIDIFSSKIGNRHIGCKTLLTPEKIQVLKELCTQNGIPFGVIKEGAEELLYWVKNPTTEHCTDGLRILDTESDTGLMHWFWFMYLPWEQFVELLSGVYRDKNQEFHDNILYDYDTPFIEKDLRNQEHHMEELFRNGTWAGLN